MHKQTLERLLTVELGLRTPRFKCQPLGRKLSGHIISDAFKGKTDAQRQRMIWDALEGPESVHEVGTLLAYTDDEWDIDLPAKAG